MQPWKARSQAGRQRGALEGQALWHVWMLWRQAATQRGAAGASGDVSQWASGGAGGGPASVTLVDALGVTAGGDSVALVGWGEARLAVPASLRVFEEFALSESSR